MKSLLSTTAAVLLATTRSHVAHAQEMTCADLSAVSCQACVGASCGYDATGTCLDSCDIATPDVSCFATVNFVGLTAVEICDIAEAAAEDTNEDLIGQPPLMMESPPVVPSGSSSAFSETTVGGSETLDIECPAFVDTALDTPISCDECLEAGCVYTQTGQCLSSCMVVADAACWDLTESGVGAIGSICQAAATMSADAEVCGVASDSCATCTNTLKTDGISSCAWYAWEGTDAGGYCGSGECDWSGNCGMATCEDVTSSGSSNSTMDEMTDHSDTDDTDDMEATTDANTTTSSSTTTEKETTSTTTDRTQPEDSANANTASAATSEQGDRAVSAGLPSVYVQPWVPILVIGGYFLLIVVG